MLYFGIVGWICLFVVFVDLDPDCFFVFFILGLWWRFFFLVEFCGFFGVGVVVILDRVCCFLFKRVSFYCFVLWFL